MYARLMNPVDWWLPNYTCQACGKEIQYSDNQYLCSQCMNNLPIMQEATTTHYAPFRYAEPVRSMILSLKYNDNGLVAKALAPYLAAIYLHCIKQADKTFIIVPVPLAKSRFRERGFNQSLLLAREVAEYLTLPVRDDLLVRTRKTVIQKHMDAATRAQNMQGAFTVPLEKVANVRGQNVLLIDDVYTTGATTGACKDALRAAGAADVQILTVAAVTDF